MKSQRSDKEIVLTALDNRINGLGLRIVLTARIGVPNEDQSDLLTEAEQVFAPKPVKKSKPQKAKAATPIKAASKPVRKATAKRSKQQAKPITAW